MSRLALRLGLLLILPAAALPETHIIHPDGSGDFPTIQAAINVASNGDVIELTDGTFAGDGNRDIDYLGKEITVRSQSGNPDDCVIDCQGSEADPHRGFLFQSHESSLCRLEGISITGGYARGHGGAILCDNAEPTIESVIVSECYAWHGGAVALQTTEGWPAWGARFGDCIFAGNSCDGPHCWGGAVLIQGLDAPADPQFCGCTFVDNWAGVGGGLICADTYYASPLVRNCTFVRNHADQGSGICYLWLSPALIVQNTIIAFGTGGAGMDCDGPHIAELTCCDFFGNEGGDWIGDIADQYGINGNICLDPRFCDPASGDFSLAEDSPCAPFSPPNSECDLIGAWPIGCWSDVQEGAHCCGERVLLLTIPNPLSPPVCASYRIPSGRAPVDVVCGVFDLRGRLMRKIEEGMRLPGAHVVSWDGRNMRGQPVASGVYRLRINAGGQAISRPLVLVR